MAGFVSPKCPRCLSPMEGSSVACSSCGLTLEEVDKQFGKDGVILDRLTDSAHLLKAAERHEIQAALHGFEQQFPQLFLAVYIGALSPLASARQFGFWLLNRAAITGMEYSRPNENGTLLIVDVTSKSISVTLGYYVERFIAEKDLNALLRQSKPAFGRDKAGQGVTRFIHAYRSLLRKRAALAAKSPERFVQRPIPPVAGQELKRLRAGHATGPLSHAPSDSKKSNSHV